MFLNHLLNLLDRLLLALWRRKIAINSHNITLFSQRSPENFGHDMHSKQRVAELFFDLGAGEFVLDIGGSADHVHDRVFGFWWGRRFRVGWNKEGGVGAVNIGLGAVSEKRG